MECNKRNRNICYANFAGSNLKKLSKYLVLQSNIFLYFCNRFSKLKMFFSVLGPLFFTFLADLSKQNVALFWEWLLNLRKGNFGRTLDWIFWSSDYVFLLNEHFPEKNSQENISAILNSIALFKFRGIFHPKEFY